MPFNYILLWVMLAVLLISAPCDVWAEGSDAVRLSIKPGKCIALHKGQDCYQTVKFFWQTPAQQEYCLFAQSASQPLTCWQGAGKPPYIYEFIGKETHTFYLRDESGHTLREIQLVVAWVYTSSKRESGGWRLF